MKKSFFKVLLIAALAVTTAFSASAFDMETVESAAETETVVQAALTEESTDYVLDANGGEVELTFELGAELIIDTGKSEALCEEYDDGTNQCVRIAGTGYSGVVTVTDGTVTKTVHLYGGKNFKPGLNIFTGTTENLKFSELGAENAASILGIDASYFTEYEGATVLGLVSSGQKSIPFLKNADLDERNLDISVKYTGSVKQMFIINPSTSAHHYSLYWGAVNVWTAGKDNRYTTWQTARNNSGDYPGLCSNAGCRDNTLKCNTKKHSILNLDYVSYDSAKEEAALYIGEWNITPYYKATYMDSDGTTVLGTDYFVCDGTGTILTSYTPSFSAAPTVPSELEGKIVSLEGWTTVPGGTEAMSSVELNNEDIVLYPVFGEFAFEPMDALAASKTYSLDIFTKAGITIESADFDYGYSEATAVFADNAVTVTANGYAGVISVILTDSDGNTYPYEIRLFGGKYSKPGLNIYTGTAEALNIGDLGGLISGNKLTLKNLDNADVAAKDGAKGFFAKGKTILKTSDFETTRPLGISTAYIGTSNGLAVVDMAWQIHTLFYGASGVQTTTEWATASNLLKNGICRSCNNTSSNANIHKTLSIWTSDSTADIYLNNLNITPYYKITYINGDTTTDVYALYDENGALLAAYTPDASVLGAKFYTLAADSYEYYPVSAPIALEHKDITLYAYTPDDENVPVNTKQTSIRLAANGKSAGIRFLSYVSAATRASADEYGYLVAREDVLTAAGCTADDLKFGTDTSYMQGGKNFIGHTEQGVKFTGAVNYSKANGIDIVYSTDAETGAFNFTGVTVGLDSSYKKGGITYANRYAVRFTTRPYVKIGDLCFYGASTTASLAEKAQALIDGGDTSEELQNIVDQAGKEA